MGRHRKKRGRSRSEGGPICICICTYLQNNPTVSKCVAVFGLSLETRESTIESIFGKFGDIERVQLVYDNHVSLYSLLSSLDHTRSLTPLPWPSTAPLPFFFSLSLSFCPTRSFCFVLHIKVHSFWLAITSHPPLHFIQFATLRQLSWLANFHFESFRLKKYLFRLHFGK